MALRQATIAVFPFLVELFIAYAQKSLIEKYDAKSVGHHDIIKAGVEPMPLERCPTGNAFSTSGAIVTVNLVCGRRTRTHLVGSCRWHSPSETTDGYAKFEEKRRPNQTEPGSENMQCDCGSDYDFLPGVDILCTGLNIEGPRENIIILATSPTKLTVDAGSPVDFWIDYILHERNHVDANNSEDGHSVSITHWYNTIFAKGNWHLVHSYREDTTDRYQGAGVGIPKSVYRAYMRIDSATVDESGVYTFEITYDSLAATLAFFLNVRTVSTLLDFYLRKPPNGEVDYDPFEKLNPRFLEARANYEIVCAATVGDHDSVNGQNLTLHLYRIPCTQDRWGNTVCPGETSKLPVTAVTQASFQTLDSVNGRHFSYRTSGRHSVITYSIVATEPGIYKCVVTSGDNQSAGAREVSDMFRFIPIDIPGAVEKRGAEIIIKANSNSLPIDHSTFYESDRVVFECRYQSIDYRFQHWQFVGDRDHARTITHNTSRYRVEYERGSTPYSAAVTRLVLPKSDASRDSGKYICSLSDARSGGKAVNIQRVIRILHPRSPSFADYETSSTIRVDRNETDSLNLSCRLSPHAAPSPHIAWFKNGQPLSGLFAFSADSQEVRSGRLLQEDSANYSCEVKNRAGAIRRDFLVTVFGQEKLGRSAREDRSRESMIAVLCLLIGFIMVLTAVLAAIAFKSYRRKKRLTALHRQLITSTKSNVAALDPHLPVNQQPENLPYDVRYEVRKDRLVLGTILGEGQFGKVLDGYVFSEDREHSVRVAVKVPKDGMNIQHQKMLLSEFKIMAYVGNHVNVLGLVAAVTHRMPKGELYVASEYCEHGALRSYLMQRRSTFYNELEFNLEKNGYVMSNEMIRRSRSAWIASTTAGHLHSQHSETAALLEKSLRTSDLLSFAYQVANGMDYLASKNVVHRDLALRNILLTKDNVIKIGDFGLALHRMDDARNSAEAKTNDIPLPAKWMAMESILYGEYSVQSDVWSFGVVLWEIFSLAETPYPDKAPSAALGEWLLAGNRLAPPKYAPEEIYHLMTKCWREQPLERPSFVDCRDEIGMDLHLRSQEAFETLQNLLNSYHAYVNFQGSIMSDDSLLPSSESDLHRFTVCEESPKGVAAENLEYNLSLPKDTVVAVENQNYTGEQNMKLEAWV